MKKETTSVESKLKDLTIIVIAGFIILAVLIIGLYFKGDNNRNNTYSNSSSSGNQTASGDTNNSESNTNTEYDVSEFNEVSYEDFKKLIKSEGTHVIYFGRSTCGWCVKFIPNMKEVQKTYNFKHDYLDVSKIYDYANNKMLNQTAYNEIIAIDQFFKDGFLTTPMIAIFKDGKYVDGSLGYMDVDTYKTLLEKNGFKK